MLWTFSSKDYVNEYNDIVSQNEDLIVERLLLTLSDEKMTIIDLCSGSLQVLGLLNRCDNSDNCCVESRSSSERRTSCPPRHTYAEHRRHRAKKHTNLADFSDEELLNSRKYGDYIGIDATREMLEEGLARRPGTKVLLSDLTLPFLPVRVSTPTLLTCLWSIYHIPGGMTHAKRWLSQCPPGVRFLFTLGSHRLPEKPTFWNNLHPNDPHYFEPTTPFEISRTFLPHPHTVTPLSLEDPYYDADPQERTPYHWIVSGQTI